MKLLDREILFRRTVREYLLLALGVGAIVHDVMYARNPGWNITGYSIAIAAFAFRLFPARAMGVAWCVSATVLHISSLQYEAVREMPFQWIALMPFAILLLLASRDLVDRFERAPSRVSWLPNYWASVPASFRRMSIWTCYALGSMAAMLFYAYLASSDLNQAEPWALYVPIGAIVTVLLLIAGRSFGFLAACGLGAYTAVAVYPHIGAARAWVGGDWPSEPMSGLFMTTPHYALPLFFLGIATAAIAAPYTLRLIVRAARG